MSNTNLFDSRVKYAALTGSHAYGLAIPGKSDEDWRGFYALPTVEYFGLMPVQEQIEGNGDAVFWELSKYIRLLMDNNPNVLETLWAKTYSVSDDADQYVSELRSNRKRFLSKKLIRTYGGYATAQWGRGIKYIGSESNIAHGWKHLMHLCRLLLDAEHVLLYGELLLDMGEYRDKLLSIRRGELTLEEVTAWRDVLENNFNRAKDSTALLDAPDYDFANNFLVDFRLSNI